MRVLVTNGDTRPALAITRSLGRRNHEVIVAAERHPSIASASRYCAGRETYPPPDQGADPFVAAIAEIVGRRRIDLLLPVTEIATTLLAEHRQWLPQGCSLPLPATDSLRVANDKSRILALANELRIPAPRTITLASPGDPVECEAMQYPVVIKPAHSRVRMKTGWLSAGVDYALSPDDLRKRLDRLSPELYPVLLQERIVGPGVGVFACFRQGQPLAFFSHRRLREKPPSGGVSVLSESVPLDPDATRHAERLLSRLNWHGVAMVEFKRDHRDGSLRLMEVNGRFWGSLQLAIDAGVDFPGLVASIAANEPDVTQSDYQVGIRTRWLLGDLDALLLLLTRSRASLNLPNDHPGRLHTAWQVFRPWQKRQRNEVMRPDDRGPGWLEIRQWLTGG